MTGACSAGWERIAQARRAKAEHLRQQATEALWYADAGPEERQRLHDELMAEADAIERG